MQPDVTKLNGDREQVYKPTEMQTASDGFRNTAGYLASVCIIISNMLTYVARFASSLLTELDEQGRQHV
jgi:hypothetical protein